MSAVAKESVRELVRRLWRDPAAWATTADIFVIPIAVSLPWSTSLVAIFAAAFLVSMVPFLDAKAFLQSLKRPICALPTWIGLLVVVQNIFTSLFNSHLFDFHEGWMYVLGVGVAGGMVLKTGWREATLELRNSVKP